VGYTRPLVEWVTGLFLGDKTVGLSLSSAEVKEGVEQYVFPSRWAFATCYMFKFTSTYIGTFTLSCILLPFVIIALLELCSI